MRDFHRLGLMTFAALGAMLTTPAAAAYGQVQTSTNAKPVIVDALMRDIAQVEEKLIALGEAMPESTYGWRPGEGVRSTSEVMMHIAADNYFLPTVAGTAAPASTGIKADDYPSVQAYEQRSATKAEALEAVRQSFSHLRTAMGAANDAALARQLTVFGSDMTGTELWVMTTTHLHEHLGQMIAYARSNGVVPPWSQ